MTLLDTRSGLCTLTLVLCEALHDFITCCLPFDCNPSPQQVLPVSTTCATSELLWIKTDLNGALTA
jgi:hypothetical protein